MVTSEGPENVLNILKLLSPAIRLLSVLFTLQIANVTPARRRFFSDPPRRLAGTRERKAVTRYQSTNRDERSSTQRLSLHQLGPEGLIGVRMIVRYSPNGSQDEDERQFA
jgi:hypothetical protein